jgi:hypothetical protein
MLVIEHFWCMLTLIVWRNYVIYMLSTLDEYINHIFCDVFLAKSLKMHKYLPKGSSWKKNHDFFLSSKTNKIWTEFWTSFNNSILWTIFQFLKQWLLKYLNILSKRVAFLRWFHWLSICFILTNVCLMLTYGRKIYPPFHQSSRCWYSKYQRWIFMRRKNGFLK